MKQLAQIVIATAAGLASMAAGCAAVTTSTNVAATPSQKRVDCPEEATRHCGYENSWRLSDL